jgi:tetratricopeptide (TPR) repeat protein
LVLALAGAAIGCAETPQQAVQEKLKTMESERSPDKMLARGHGFAAVGDMTRAEQYFASALEAGADEKVVLPLLIETCVSDGRYRAAIEYARPYAERHPEDLRMRFVLGTLLQAVGEPKAARVELEVVVKRAPAQADAHYALAVLLRDEINDSSAAETEFREYLRLAPQGPHAEEARNSLTKAAP